jgi:Glycosyl transferase family 2
MKKIAVVTPYFNESLEILRRCHDSVVAQTLPATHYMVADGRPRPEIEHWPVRHIALPQNIGSWGATPRGIGAIIAFAEGADAVAFLDADNWVSPNHTELIVEALGTDPDFIWARAHIMLPDGDELPQGDKTIRDTNCTILTRKSSFMAPIWSMFPPSFGAGEDGLTSPICEKLNLTTEIISRDRTVWYYTNYLIHYQRMGKKPVIGTKDRPDSIGVVHEWNSEVYRQATGIALPVDLWRNLSPDRPRPKKPRLDANNCRIAAITLIDGEGAGNIKQQGHSNSDGISRILIGKERPKSEPAGDDRIIFELPYPDNRAPALDETIAAIFAFQRGYDVVVFVPHSVAFERAKVLELARAAAKLNAKSNAYSVSAGEPKLYDVPVDQPLVLHAVPRTIAGRFIHRNLARGVPGFEGRMWRRVLNA